MQHPTFNPIPQPAGGPPPVEPPRKLNRAGRIALVVCSLVALLCVAGVGLAAYSAGDGGAGRPAATFPADPGRAAADTTAAAPTAAAAAAPKPGDFTLEVEILKRECFGSAGCNVRYRVTAGWSVPVDRDWLVTYEVRGVEDGPALETMTVRPDDTFDAPSESFGQVKTAKTKLRAVAVRVGQA